MSSASRICDLRAVMAGPSVLVTDYGTIRLPAAFDRALNACRMTAAGQPDQRTTLGRRVHRIERRIMNRMKRRFLRAA